MIRGIGMDLVSISFVEQMLAKCGELFIQQYYSMEERELFACKKRHAEQFLAGRFAAKEALLKAIGTGMNCELDWNELEFLSLPSGQPYLVRSRRLESYIQQQESIHVSISHHGDYAAAFIIIESSQ
ncbi:MULTISPECIES: holo-ACP synthase [unclassified Paenibacillus]|uniref:holo-ACP synthase n=1 Tax=unclassified Paenibacillus TaxID=185978 RepID=UPI0003E26080|nr:MULTISPECIES: holo-ACP synthase [unclassified Paenibacillus]ETT45595.1 4'-phosphopantetheinyl transferase [Paenibacillus sp. FSL R7-269]OMF85866.1 holo-[acyl-carrier-protein] synthase [Paenibacillus sp. FSL R7-0337]